MICKLTKRNKNFCFGRRHTLRVFSNAVFWKELADQSRIRLSAHLNIKKPVAQSLTFTAF